MDAIFDEHFKKSIVYLTDQQITAARKIAKSLAKCIGRENAISKDSIIDAMAKLKVPYIITKEELFEIVQYIRFNNLCDVVIETHQSYFVETDPEKIDNYMLYLVERVKEIISIHHAITVQQSKQTA